MSSSSTHHHYSHHALHVLKERGYRITTPRRRVIELLAQSPVPMSAYDIRDRLLEMEQKVDTVSVYRILDCLEENGLLHRIRSSGKVMKCHHADHCHGEETHDHDCTEISHHILVLCQVCQQVTELEDPNISQWMDHVAKTAGFRLTGHTLEFYGECSQCQTQPSREQATL